jgi:hypothetical protein
MKALVLLLFLLVFFGGCTESPIRTATREPSQVAINQFSTIQSTNPPAPAQPLPPVDFLETSEWCYVPPEKQEALYNYRIQLYQAIADIKASINARKIETTLMAPQEEITLITSLASNPTPNQETKTLLKLFQPFLSSGQTSILQADLPYPRNINGPISEQIRQIVKKNIVEKYLFKGPFTEAEVQELRASAKLPKDLQVWKQADTLLQIKRAKDSNLTLTDVVNMERAPAVSAMDQYLVPKYMEHSPAPFIVKGVDRPVTTQEALAIDALARTLMGEAISCDPKTDQFTAITRIILNRKDKLLKAISEKKSPLLVYGRDPAEKIRLTPNGQNFMTVGELHPVAQIVSAPKQFDAWAERVNGVQTPISSLRGKGQINPKNIPLDTTVGFYKPFVGNSMSDLYYTLCPPVQGSPNRPAWDHAVALATEAIVDPQGFEKTYRWNPNNNNILFYSHGPDVEGAIEVPKIQLLECTDNKAKSCKQLRLYQGDGTCSSVRFFVPNVTSKLTSQGL